MVSNTHRASKRLDGKRMCVGFSWEMELKEGDCMREMYENVPRDIIKGLLIEKSPYRLLLIWKNDVSSHTGCVK